MFKGIREDLRHTATLLTSRPWRYLDARGDGRPRGIFREEEAQRKDFRSSLARLKIFTGAAACTFGGAGTYLAIRWHHILGEYHARYPGLPLPIDIGHSVKTFFSVETLRSVNDFCGFFQVRHPVQAAACTSLAFAVFARVLLAEAGNAGAAVENLRQLERQTSPQPAARKASPLPAPKR